MMELSPRKQAVLSAIIKAYIETGEPVGSKILTSLIENAPSSATLRNEMSELCSLGLLEQPHTSAGRIPTTSGFRMYVNSLMKPTQISGSAKNFIDSRLNELNCDPEKIPSEAGQILSDLTGLPAVTYFITENTVTVRRIELLPISRHSAMLFLITSDGRTRNRVFRFSSGFTKELNERFSEIVKNKICGQGINDLTKAYMQSVIAATGIDSLVLMPLLSAVFEMASEIEVSSVSLNGESCLYNVCGNEEAARKIISLIQRRDPIISMINDMPDDVGVVFGNDTGYRELNSDTIVAAKYNGADKYKGAICVIGPNRMSYEQIVPSIEYMAKKLSNIMTEAQKDMED